MTRPFARSLNALETDTFGSSLLVIILASGLMAAWAAWAVLGRASIQAVSDHARLEVDRGTFPVQAEVGGRVVSAQLTIGRDVTVGDVLVELDAEHERQQLAEADALLVGSSKSREAILRQIDAEEQSLHQDQTTASFAIGEAEARLRAADVAATLAADEGRRTAELRARGLASEIDFVRARSSTDQRNAERDMAARTVDRLRADQQRRATDHRVRKEALERDLAELDGHLQAAKASTARLEHAVERRRIKAHTSGRIAEAVELRAGQVLREGEPIATIVARRPLMIAAYFAPGASLGRIKTGQTAKVRFQGFPWTRYGTAAATVTGVAGDVRDGFIRVDLAINSDSMAVIPAQHGLPATIEVEVERVSPAGFLLRAAGAYLEPLTRHADQ